MRKGSRQVGLGLAGSYNVSIAFEGPLAGGEAQAMDKSFMADRRGRPYQYQVGPAPACHGVPQRLLTALDVARSGVS